MFKFALRLASSAVLLSAAMCASASAETTYKDFSLSGTLQEFAGPSLRCASKFGGNIVGHGDSPLLGPVAFAASDCITPNGTSFTFSDGRFAIVTTTGEQVYATYSGQFVPTGVGSNYVFSSATFQITGGTGKYAKASGGGTLTGGEDMATGAGTIQLTGRILSKD